MIEEVADLEDMEEKEEISGACCGHTHGEGSETLWGKIPDEEALSDLADFFKVFGDLTRVKILYVLREQEMCVCDLASTLGMTSPAVSHQLRILKGSRLIASTRRGKSVYYRLNDQHIHGILSQGLEHTSE